MCNIHHWTLLNTNAFLKAKTILENQRDPVGCATLLKKKKLLQTKKSKNGHVAESSAIKHSQQCRQSLRHFWEICVPLFGSDNWSQVPWLRLSEPKQCSLPSSFWGENIAALMRLTSRLTKRGDDWVICHLVGASLNPSKTAQLPLFLFYPFNKKRRGLKESFLFVIYRICCSQNEPKLLWLRLKFIIYKE